MDFDEERLKRRVIVKDVPFGGLDDGQPHLGGQISLKKGQKCPFCWHVENGVKISDVTEQ